MKVYFTASIVGKRQYLQNYLKISEITRKLGHGIESDHILSASEATVDLQGKPERERFHRQLKQWIMDADCMIVETSFPSISVGFEISLALSLGKSVLLLYTNEAPTLLSSYNDERLICEKYTLSTLEDNIASFLNYVTGKSDQRFTFFVTAEIAHHLEEVSRVRKMPKSVYVRKLIERDMQDAL